MEGDGQAVKTSKEIIGLPVFSIAEVLNLGDIKDLLINPDNGTVDFVVVEPQNTFKENGLIPFADVVGIGEDALTVRNQGKIIPFSSNDEAMKLQDKNVKIINSKVMTEKGTITGIISEILVNEETGEIVGCEWVPNDEERAVGYIPSKYVITFGRDMIIVDKNFKQYVTDGVSAEDTFVNDEPQPETNNKPEIESEDPLKFFEDKQNEYLIGRKITSAIVSDEGEVIANEGDIVTPEIIEQAIAADKYIELTINTVEEN